MDVPARFLLTPVAFGAYLVQLFVVVAVALEPANMVETPLVGYAHGQGLDAQVKSHGTVVAHRTWLALLASVVFGDLFLVLLCIIVDERARVVAARIPGYRYLPEVLWWCFGEMGNDVGVAFVASSATRGKYEGIALYF